MNSSTYPTVHVRYQIGSVESAPLLNVNATELHLLIKTLLVKLKEQDDKSYDILLKKFLSEAILREVQIESDPDYDGIADGIMDALIHTTKLTLNQDAKCDFFKNWWRSKTRAGSVVCMLENVIEDQKKKEEALIEDEIRKLSIGINLQNTTTVHNQDVLDYIRRKQMGM